MPSLNHRSFLVVSFSLVAGFACAFVPTGCSAGFLPGADSLDGATGSDGSPSTGPTPGSPSGAPSQGDAGGGEAPNVPPDSTGNCASDRKLCGSVCSDLQIDPAHCGDCTRVCTARDNGIATCQAGTCGFSCNAGFHLCGADCVAESPSSCGVSCKACTAPANADSVCSSGTCSYTCKPGFNRIGNDCYPPHDFWRTVASMPSARSDFAAVTALDGRIFAIGGENRTNVKYLSTVEAYDPKTDQWTTAASMPTARAKFGAAIAPDGRIFALGGTNASTNALTTVEAYDPKTNQWTTAASMPTTRIDSEAAVAPDGRIFVIGGFNGSKGLTTVDAYDPKTNQWATNVVTNTITDHYAYVAAIPSGGRIFVIDIGQYTPAEAYDAATNQWQKIAPLKAGGGWLAAAAALDGRIFAMGGWVGSTGGTLALATVQAYNPKTNQWAAAASMHVPRGGLAAATALDGRIFAIGGYNYADLSTVEVYTP